MTDYPHADDDHYFAIPVEIHDELVDGAFPVARPAPGVRVDLGAAVDAVRIALGLGGGLSTVIVVGQHVREFSARVARALKERGADQVTVESPEEPSSLVDVSDEDLYRELLRRLGEQPTQ